MNYARCKLLSAAPVAAGLGMAAAASPASAVTLYPEGTSGPGQRTLGTDHPG
jgi:hypothetical protein